ncbi:class I SAM-dependent methyltransferase [Parafrankia sp. FMc2]|uniref:class I SAM-dependent methyltransferase n=1 Tax=Parafrankia sp. FMc2 TaxID=3233196 RepID=UPI0034D76F09
MPINSPENINESLLLAAGGSPEELISTIEQLTLQKTAPALVDEIVARCLPRQEMEVELLFEIFFGKESTESTLTFGNGRIKVTGGRAGDPGAHIRFEAADLVTALYGPAGRPGGLTREVHSLLKLPGRGSWEDTYQLFLTQTAYAEVIQLVLAACSPRTPDLGELSVRYRSDKWGFLHWFTGHYENHFRHLLDEPVRLLEIGIGGYGDTSSGGASLRMWQNYFRRGRIFGLDVYEKTSVHGPRLRTIVGDQNDPAAMRRLGEQVGPFDVIIDDGSHVSEHVLTSFEALFPYLRDGGLYVIEDFGTTYWPGFGGARPDAEGAQTAMTRMKGLLDGLHYPEYEDAAIYQPSLTDRTVSAVHFYRNLVFIEKGLNAEPGPPEWMPRSPV